MNPADRIEQAARLLADLHRPGPRPCYAGLHLAARGTQVSVEFAGLGVARLEVS